ncbi:4Fe-4S ferredoxin [Verrucomicrobia bacterium LW23]|nr:4Fe-4S ferredoxin [Verrucomicrobia bacterium LW23]
MVLLAGYFTASDVSSGVRAIWLGLAWGGVVSGTLLYGLHKHLSENAGVRNHGKTTESLTARGALGWILAVLLTAFYVVLYWFPEMFGGITRLHDPLSQALRGRPADHWFLYGTAYTVGTTIMGAKALAKYRHSRYQVVRTLVIMASQLVMAYLLPGFLASINQPEAYLTYFWPLAYENLFPGSIQGLMNRGAFGTFVVAWSFISIFVATPILTYFYGKRWYCSWVCGCGGLANTVGDSFRQISDKSLRAWQVERYTVYGVLVFIVLVTGLLWLEPYMPAYMHEPLYMLRKTYGFLIGMVLAGVVGVGAYPLMGTRVWCRFFCPMAAVLGIIQRFFSRFRITTNGGQCISCGNCSKYCEMGIDVRSYAQRGENIVRASCVGCGVCATVCPRGVLSLENGPTEDRLKGYTAPTQPVITKSVKRVAMR